MLFTARATIFLFFIASLVLSCSSEPQNTNDEIDYIYYRSVTKRYQDNDSLEYHASRLHTLTQNSTISNKVKAALVKGLFSIKKLSYQKALNEYNHAAELLKETDNDSLEARTFASIANAYKGLNDFAAATDNYYKGLTLYEKLHDKDRIASIHANLSQIYQMKGDIAEAKKHVAETLNVLENDKFKLSYGIALHSLANIYGMTGKYDSALAIDKIGIALYDSMKAYPLKTTFLDNKANCFREMGRYDSAEFYFKECLIIDSTYNNIKLMSDTYSNLGAMYLSLNKHEQAEQTLLHAIKLAHQIPYYYVIHHSWNYLNDLYKKQNRLAKAMDAKDSAALYKDKLINEKSELKIKELQELYASQKKEQTILLQQSKISKQNIINIALILLCLALFIIGYLLYKRYKLKREQELQKALRLQQEQATINILQAEENERKRIASDLHDGVGQLMTAALMNMKAASQNDNISMEEKTVLFYKALELLSESCNEVRMVSHKMMPNALLKKGLLNAVRDFVQQLRTETIKINVSATGLDTPLPDVTETILFRVIQESVSNAIKHSKAERLDINIHKDEKEITLMIEDNGVGFNKENLSENDGIGIKNITSRVEYLKGTIDISSSEGKGTLIAIHIPL